MNPREKSSEPGREAGTVVGLFRSQPQAERAIHDLKDAGFPDDRIGVVMQDPEQQQQLSADMGTKAGEGAAMGALGGGVLGGVLGLLAEAGALVIPGIGPIIAGGALASTLAGAGIGAAAGGLLGTLAGMGVPEEEARHYERGVREGGILVTVAAAGRAIDTRRILANAGAEPAPAGQAVDMAVDEQARLDLREEELRATKDRGRREEDRVEERAETEAWRGNERRYQHDRKYTGPERRVGTV